MVQDISQMSIANVWDDKFRYWTQLKLVGPRVQAWSECTSSHQPTSIVMSTEIEYRRISYSVYLFYDIIIMWGDCHFLVSEWLRQELAGCSGENQSHNKNICSDIIEPQTFRNCVESATNHNESMINANDAFQNEMMSPRWLDNQRIARFDSHSVVYLCHLFGCLAARNATQQASIPLAPGSVSGCNLVHSDCMKPIYDFGAR